MLMERINDCIKNIRAHGRSYFTSQEISSLLKISRNAANCALYRLKKRGDIVSPARNLYLIVPPEYQILGCLPAEHMIPILMSYWKIDYYVCLLSAARYHGATHQAIQRFYVMVKNQRRSIKCGKISVHFVVNKNLLTTPTQQITTSTGYLTISSPEATAIDLLRYPMQSGGLNHIATVLTELIEKISPKKLLSYAQNLQQLVWVQRLGYLLEIIAPDETKKKNLCVKFLKNYTQSQHTKLVALAPNMPTKGFPKNVDWNLIINMPVESDI